MDVHFKFNQMFNVREYFSRCNFFHNILFNDFMSRKLLPHMRWKIFIFFNNYTFMYLYWMSRELRVTSHLTWLMVLYHKYHHIFLMILRNEMSYCNMQFLSEKLVVAKMVGRMNVHNSKLHTTFRTESKRLYYNLYQKAKRLFI